MSYQKKVLIKTFKFNHLKKEMSYYCRINQLLIKRMLSFIIDNVQCEF